MKRVKFLSVLLCLALLASMPAAPALAAEGGNDGMVVNKTAVYNDATKDYTITLEAYATGSKVISSVSQDVPTDIILVLDQSGSMANDMGTVSFKEYSGNDIKNSNLYSKRHNGGDANLWYKLSDGSYVSVNVTKTTTYKELGTDYVNYKYRNRQVTSDCYYYYKDNLYEFVDGEYKKVTVTRQEEWGGGSYTYTYTFADGSQDKIYGNNEKPIDSDEFKKHAPLYTPNADDSNTVYTYTYTLNGKTETIGTSTGKDNPFTTVKLYSRTVSSSGGGKRLDVLMSAAKNFADSVAKKAEGADGKIGTTDDVDHRIAVVGFASNTTTYENTEVLTGCTISEGAAYNPNYLVNNKYNYYYPQGNSMLGVQYGSENIVNAYKNAFQSMKTDTGKTNVITALNALTAQGGTQTDHGLDMANKIFENNPIPANETRNRVVVVFTDGIPTGNSSIYNSTVAGNAITNANKARDSYGATVYTIGIFSGADATKAGSTTTSSEADKGNYVCQQISNNKGTPQSPSYYLSASDAGSLNNIFQQIADQIESGSSSTTLGSETVIKDIIAPQFTLPEGATAENITLETYACTGKSGDEYTWKKNVDAMGATATVDAPNGKVDVTGFDFAKNYVAEVKKDGGVTGYKGHKLVIKFNVKAKDGFLGGNDVYTNTSAGVYENKNATEPVKTFPRPTVNVPIKDVNVTAEDKNVYLTKVPSEADLKTGVMIKCGDIDITDPNKLADWQKAYVDIDGTITTTTSPADFDATADGTYTVGGVTVKPKTDGSTVGTSGGTANDMNGKTNSATQNIYVFKPALTFKDNTVDYMSAINGTKYVSDKTETTYAAANYNSTATQWKHGDTLSTGTGVTMIGQAPNLNLAYTTTSGVDDGKVTSTTYVPVKVTVEIGTADVTSSTTFAHAGCSVTGCEWGTVESTFLLHVINKFADLTIQKEAKGVEADPGQSFLFEITGPNGYTNEVIIVGNGSVTIKDLPIGEYTVTEDTNWSWRYTPEGGKTQTKPITAGGDNTVKFKNIRTEDKWLDGNTNTDNVFTSGGIVKNPTAATN